MHCHFRWSCVHSPRAAHGSLVATPPAKTLKGASSILSGRGANRYTRTAPGSRSGAAPGTRHLLCSSPALLQLTIPFAEQQHARPWSSGYDVNVIPWRSPVRCWPGVTRVTVCRRGSRNDRQQRHGIHPASALHEHSRCGHLQNTNKVHPWSSGYDVSLTR